MLAAIKQELAHEKKYLNGQKVETIYLGGGTPSLLSASELSSIFAVIDQHYDLNDLKECSLEANPDDLNQNFIKSIKHSPINRFSIGVQSFYDRDLVYMNRAHSAQQATYAIKAAQDAGFEKLTIDLIYGTPGLSHQAWLDNLAQAHALSIPHLSAYALTVEEGTALHYAINKKKQTPVDQDQSATQFELLMQYAPSMGYEQYEISNFAQDSQYALHNTNYWRGTPYLGIGPSAHSYDGNNRRHNLAHNALYIKNILANKQPIYEEEHLSNKQRLNEYLMTGLRTKWGCHMPTIEERWGLQAAKSIQQSTQLFIDKEWMCEQNKSIFLTNKGKLFADHIASTLFVV